MSIFDRMSSGWKITMTSMKVLKANKQLLTFPVLSGLTLLVIAAAFFVPMWSGYQSMLEKIVDKDGTMYLVMFGGYVVGYFVIVFFNMALMHCTRLYFNGEEATVAKGLQFSMSRIWVILQWALFAGTIGTILKIIQDNAGWLGKIIIGLIGFAWSIGTFFVVPILAYEQTGPADAVKRSVQLMKEKWGERIGASFSFGLINLLLFGIFGITGLAVSALIHEGAGIAIFLLGLPVMFIVNSALNSIFISAVYHNISTDIETHFSRQMLDGLFEEKQK
ncbi:MAG: DUF6159 family protein [Bacteroidota bacterium]